MTAQKIAILIPGSIIALLTWAALIRYIVMEWRGRALFMRETGLLKGDWKLLTPKEQGKWMSRDREDRELAKFAADFSKRRKC